MSLYPSPNLSSGDLQPDTQLPDKYLACLDCAKSKSKCDRRYPCSRCSKKGIQCKPRLTQRGPGRPIGPSVSSSQSSRQTAAGRPNSRAKTSFDATGTVGDGYRHMNFVSSSSTTLSDLNHHTGPHNEAGLLEDPSEGVLNMVGPSYVHQGATEHDHHSKHYFNTLMQHKSFDMADILGPTQPLGIRNTNNSHEALLTHTQSPNTISIDDTFDFMKDITSSVVDQSNSGALVDSLLEESMLDGSILGLEWWPLFECNPLVPLASCPLTAREHLKNLYNASNLHDASCYPSFLSDYVPLIEPLTGGTRDKLIATMQSFSNKAQRIHGLTSSTYEKWELEPTAPFPLILPSPQAMNMLLSACLRLYELYYPFLCAVSLKTNKLLDAKSNAVNSSLRLLLMLSAGAMTATAGNLYQIAHGLLEIGRISICHLIKEDIKLASNPDMLQCALGYIIVAAWCGDKWLMETAIYQRVMYIEMLRRYKFFEQRSLPVTITDTLDELETSWQRWQEQESINRTAYTWVILDQEMCLFQDSASNLFASVTDFKTSVPNPDSIWQATSARQWAQLMSQHGSSGAFPPSLNDYIRRFRDTPNVETMNGVTPVVLRLLLCPLQDMVGQVRKMVADTASSSRQSRSTRHIYVILVSVQLDAARELLQKWYTLAKHSHIDNASPTKLAAMILYRLLVLNTLVSFSEVERLARGEDTYLNSESSGWQHLCHHDDHQHIYFHCGQVLRIICELPEHTRPTWWAGAIYRVALTAWANSMSAPDEGQRFHESADDKPPLVALDKLAPEDPLIETFLENQQGIPVFTTASGAPLYLDIPGAILSHITSLLGSNPRSDFVKGVRLKLLRVAVRWQGHPPAGEQ